MKSLVSWASDLAWQFLFCFQVDMELLFGALFSDIIFVGNIRGMILFENLCSSLYLLAYLKLKSLRLLAIGKSSNLHPILGDVVIFTELKKSQDIKVGPFWELMTKLPFCHDFGVLEKLFRGVLVFGKVSLQGFCCSGKFSLVGFWCSGKFHWCSDWQKLGFKLPHLEVQCYTCGLESGCYFVVSVALLHWWLGFSEWVPRLLFCPYYEEYTILTFLAYFRYFFSKFGWIFLNCRYKVLKIKSSNN